MAPVAGDARRVEQAVVNLVLNARDAVAPGGRVAVTVAPARLGEPLEHALGTAPAGDYYALSVSDTGCGMDAAARAKLFRPFHTTKPGGTGLGLAIVARVARDCRAAVTVASEPGRGTTFTLYFPRAAG
jgi:signal transduction histidine kinase